MNPELLAVLSALLTGRVEFAIVGGVAVIAHGYVRTTRDMDVFIRPSVENATAAFGALKKFGAPLDGMEPMDLLCDEDHLRFLMGDMHVDILNSIGEMHFEQVWNSRVEVKIDGLVIPFISKADLIANKLAIGRHRDLSDVEELEHIHSKIEDE